MNNKINNYNANSLFGAQMINNNNNINEDKKTMDELIIDTLKKLSKQENYIREYGDFAPVTEFFENPDNNTKDYVGKYGLKIYKMPKDIVPDPKMRYIEAAAYVPSGDYKSDMIVGNGYKNEILKMLKDPEFAKTLKSAYEQLLESIANYD